MNGCITCECDVVADRARGQARGHSEPDRNHCRMVRFLPYGTMTASCSTGSIFPADNALVSTMLAYTVYAVGFVTRPVGGLVFGHFGDTIGRKPLLVLTLLIMGSRRS